MASADGIRAGQPKVCQKRTARPTWYRASAFERGAGAGAGSSASGAAARAGRSAVRGPSRSRPARARSADETAPRRASSSAIAPPIEMPATCGRPRPSSAKNARTHRRRRRSSADSVGQRRRVAEARRVAGDHVELAREQASHRAPGLPALADAVQQHERRARALAAVVDRRRRAACVGRCRIGAFTPRPARGSGGRRCRGSGRRRARRS